jgi:radical SAM protein with 4Fe4S-binding SPASM domain
MKLILTKSTRADIRAVVSHLFELVKWVFLLIWARIQAITVDISAVSARYGRRFASLGSSIQPATGAGSIAARPLILTQCGDCGDCACYLGDHLSDLRLGVPLPVPVIYSLELTTQCDNRCDGCGNVFARQRTAPPLAAEQWKQILNTIAPHARHLKVTGGEPTLHPQFRSIVRAIAQRDMRFTLFTNGRWQDAPAMIDLLTRTPQCTGLLVSLHGRDARSHAGFTRVQESFEETTSNVREATEAGLLVATSTVITPYNYMDVEPIVELALSLGADHCVFNRYLGVPGSRLDLAPERLHAAVNTIERLITQGAPVRWGNPIPQCFAPNSSTGCLAGLAYCTIDPWGNLRPCNHSPTVAGNLLQEPLPEIWMSEMMQSWRNLEPAGCDMCPSLTACRGGCKALVELGQYDAIALASTAVPA